MRICIPLALVVALLGGCSKSPTTPAGMLGEVDLVPQLPAGVAAPPSTALASHETTLPVCEVEGYETAEIKVRWKTFENGGSAYITWYSVELTKAADALGVSLGKPADVGSANLTPGAPYMALATFWVKCTRRTARLDQQGGEFVQFKADGTAPTPKR